MDKDCERTQVKREHYYSLDYLNKDRFLGLYGQVNSCLRFQTANNILEIGPGPNLFSSIMNELGKKTTTIDFANDLNSNIIAKLPNIPIRHNSFDIVCAFEVLEHIPYELLTKCLEEISRVSNSLVIISVPNVSNLNPVYNFSLKIKVRNCEINKNFTKSINKEIFNKNEHFWEIGINEKTVENVIKDANSVRLNIIDCFFIEPWFQFFIFKKQN